MNSYPIKDEQKDAHYNTPEAYFSSFKWKKNLVDNLITTDSQKEIDYYFYQEYKRFEEQFVNEFVRTIRDDVLEDGMYSKVDLVCQKYYKVNRIGFLQAINRLFNKSFNNATIITFILSALAKFDYTDVSPNGETMVLVALSIKDTQVQDYALKAIEVWGAENFLENLTRIEVKSEWLQEYLNEMIRNLER